jgi:hypothetical protein
VSSLPTAPYSDVSVTPSFESLSLNAVPSISIVYYLRFERSLSSSIHFLHSVLPEEKVCSLC